MAEAVPIPSPNLTLISSPANTRSSFFSLTLPMSEYAPACGLKRPLRFWQCPKEQMDLNGDSVDPRVDIGSIHYLKLMATDFVGNYPIFKFANAMPAVAYV